MERHGKRENEMHNKLSLIWPCFHLHFYGSLMLSTLVPGFTACTQKFLFFTHVNNEFRSDLMKLAVEPTENKNEVKNFWVKKDWSAFLDAERSIGIKNPWTMDDQWMIFCMWEFYQNVSKLEPKPKITSPLIFLDTIFYIICKGSIWKIVK